MTSVNTKPSEWSYDELVQLINETVDASGVVPVGAITPGTARQVIQTNAGGTASEWTSSVSLVNGAFSGTVAIGGAALATSALSLASANLTGTSQYGINNTVTASAAATAALYGSYTSVTTFAGSNTTTNVYGAYIANPTKGAGSTITNRYGLYVEAVSGGGTINYGIYVAGGTPGIYVAAGGIRADGTGFGVNQSASASQAFAVTLTGLTGNNQTGINFAGAFSSASTTAAYGIYFGGSTAAAGFTCTNFYGAYIDAVAKGAGSTITNRYGLYIVNPTDGGTLNRAIFISGAAAICDNQGIYYAMSGTAVPATAGAVAAGAPITLYSGAITIEVTSDAPTHTRAKGSLCFNTGGSSGSTRAYINTTGSTTWTAITTAA